MKNVIIIGATSGIGESLAFLYLAQGDKVGVTGRRDNKLQAIKEKYPLQVFLKKLDVRLENSVEALQELITEMKEVDVIVICSGVGAQNPELKEDIEIDTLYTNGVGFTRMSVFAFNYFKQKKNGGHIAVISSIAETKALRQAPAYSSTKRFQSHYISCLAQKAYKERLPIRFTTVKPGFIKTDLLKRNYPLMIHLEKGALAIFKAIEKKKRTQVIPSRWIPIIWLWRMIPNRLWEKIF